MDSSVLGTSVTFGAWRYDRCLGRLFRRDSAGGWAPASIGSRANDILAALVREPGTLVSKDALMDAVWPGMIVEPNNLTVQMAALRRVLDNGNAGPSCIQTVPGRGYRLTCDMECVDEAVVQAAGCSADDLPEEAVAAPIPEQPPVPPRIRRWTMAGLGMTAAALAAIAVALYGPWAGSRTPLPRMSLVVLPIEHLGADAGEDRLAEIMTDDLTTSLSVNGDLKLMQGKAADASGKDATVARMGRVLGARYVFRATERRVADVVRVNAQLLSSETASVVWTDRFDTPDTGGSGQTAAVERLSNGIENKMVGLEAARSLSERPDRPDAFDLYLRASVLSFQPPSPATTATMRSLLEQAVRLDPASDLYKLWLIGVLLDDEDTNPHGRKSVLERAKELLAEVTPKQPKSWAVEHRKVFLLYWQANFRCPEVVDAAERYLSRYSAIAGVHQVTRWLGGCQIVLGHADEAVANMKHAARLEDGESHRSRDFRNLQFALLLLGRYGESIRTGERALAANPDDVGYERARLDRRLAAAYALTGQLEPARRRLADAERLDPYFTLRKLDAIENASPVFVAQVARVKDGLRLAGVRDHADEDADFGAPADTRLHQEYDGPTPLTLAGSTTIRTDDLVRLLAAEKPVVIDGLANFGGASIPGAVGLRYAGAGGELSDLAQDRLKQAMQALTKGDTGAPVVAVGWNSESFDGRNLALRLVALGYSRVYWYRGGREAWEVAGFPEAGLEEQEW